MDPEVALAQIRLLSASIVSAADDEPDEPWTADQIHALATEAVELAEAVQALDEWLTKGGFRPADWARA